MRRILPADEIAALLVSFAFLTRQDVLHHGHAGCPGYIAQLAVDYLWTLNLNPNKTFPAWNSEPLDLPIVAHRVSFCPAAVSMFGAVRHDAMLLQVAGLKRRQEANLSTLMNSHIQQHSRFPKEAKARQI